MAGSIAFVYTHGARMLADFQPFPQMENLEEVYESRSFSRCSPIASFQEQAGIRSLSEVGRI
jgi:hypothetical protein